MNPVQECDIDLARHWLELARQDDVSDRLEAIYAMIADQVDARRPVCTTSGRCCNFESYGHRLYVTGLEAAWCTLRLGKANQDLSTQSVEDALARGGCPFQAGLLCGAHEIKPVGCRTYYCDTTAQEWQEALTERAHGMVRALHASVGATYRYMEWRAMLGLMALALEGDGVSPAQR